MKTCLRALHAVTVYIMCVLFAAGMIVQPLAARAETLLPQPQSSEISPDPGTQPVPSTDPDSSAAQPSDSDAVPHDQPSTPETPGADSTNSDEGGAVAPDRTAQSDVDTDESSSEPSLTYIAHVTDLGWQTKQAANGEIAGTVGQNKALQALRLTLEGAAADLIQAKAHLSDIGWTNPVSSDQIIGTTGQNRPMEAISLSVGGSLASGYDIWYCVHVADFGWLDWAQNGANAGSVGYGKAIQAIRIVLQKKGTKAPGKTLNPFRDRAQEPPSVVYSAHVTNLGWQASVTDGKQAGTTGRSLSVEAVQAAVSWYGHTGTIDVRAQVQDIGWQGWKSGTGGTTGKNKHMEAIQLRLSQQISESYDIWYCVHVSEIGWMGWASNGASAGTVGKNRAIEALKIRLVPKNGEAPGSTDNAYEGPTEKLIGSAFRLNKSQIGSTGSGVVTLGDPKASLALQSLGFAIDNQLVVGGIEYRTRVQQQDWQADWHADGVQTSKDLQGLPIEGLQMKLQGGLAERYDVWYRSYDRENDWSGWACNGQSVGAVGFASGARAVQVTLVEKGGPAPGSTDNAFRVNQESPVLSYQAHSSEIGWQMPVLGGHEAGITGRGAALQALRVGLEGTGSTDDIKVCAHVTDIGWQGWVSGSAFSGTTGQNRAVQAVKIQLSDRMAAKYDVIYRVHASEYGWMGWAKNGEIAGTTGLNRQLEAIEVRLIAKGDPVPSSDVPAYITLPEISYQAHVRDIGWQDPVHSGIAGTEGQNRPIEAFKLSVDSSISGGISYCAHVENIGWQKEVADGGIAGTIGQVKQAEAIKIRLTGDLSRYFDVWYRTDVQNYGWLGWTKNGAQAGTGSINYRLEAFQVVVLAKGSPAPGSTENPYRDTPMQVNSILLPVPCLLQNPELPTGCESVALTNDLNYLGFGLRKCTMADSYIPRSNNDFVTAFWGDPHSKKGNCVSAPGLTIGANQFLTGRSSLRAYDITDSSMDRLYEEVANKHPVIVWSTINQAMIGPQYAQQWYNGRLYATYTNSHTVVLRGFDRNLGVVYIADSLTGYQTVSAGWFNLLYNLRGSQAVVVK